jgi:RNA polymerase sigma factor (sigma-70 family)
VRLPDLHRVARLRQRASLACENQTRADGFALVFDGDERPDRCVGPDRCCGVVNPPGRFGNDSPMGDARCDAEIIARASRQPELFGIVFDRHFATIHRYLERRIGRDGADELSGDVFRIAFEQRSRFQPVHESALPWLYGLATNLMLKRWRGEGRHLRALKRLEGSWRDDDADLEGADDRLSAQAARAELLDALDGLAGRDRDVLLLVAWEELTYEEVAAALGIPQGTVRSRLNRARLALRELLAGIGNEPVTVNCEPGGGVRDDG